MLTHTSFAASTITAPRAANNAETVDLPDPMPPVKPTSSTVRSALGVAGLLVAGATHRSYLGLDGRFRRVGDTGVANTAVGGTARAEAPVDPSREYRVQPNDSLHKIALKLYGKPGKADSLYELNRERIGGDSSRIKVGTVLKLPEAPTVSPTATR